MQEVLSPAKWQFLRKLNYRVNDRLHDGISASDRGLVVVSIAPPVYDHMIQEIALACDMAEWPESIIVRHLNGDSSGSELEALIDD